MKTSTILVITFFFFIQLNLFSQIPNAGFENWVSGNPDGWTTNNVMGFLSPVTQSPSAHSGTSAARLEVLNFLNAAFLPQLWSGSGALEGFPVDQSFGSLTGYYQFSPNGNDGIYITVWMLKEQQYIGGGGLEIFDAASSYNQFNVPIEYFAAGVPDTALVWFIVGGDTTSLGGNIGTFALIDDLGWGPAVGINETGKTVVDKFEIKQNYPNPFNPSTKINFSIPEQTLVELMVYDILGNEVANLVNDTYSAGEYSVNFKAENLPAGVYLARISAGKYSSTIKMTLLK